MERGIDKQGKVVFGVEGRIQFYTQPYDHIMATDKVYRKTYCGKKSLRRLAKLISCGQHKRRSRTA